MHGKHNSASGFTLIELLVVTGLSTILIMTVTSVFMTFFLSSSSTSTKAVIKQEGTAALKQIEFLLKNALAVTNCSGGSTTTLTIVSLDQQETTFSLNSSNSESRIASNSANITSAGVSATNLGFICIESTGQQTVSVAFTLSKTIPTLSTDKVATEDFLTTVTLRNTQ